MSARSRKTDDLSGDEVESPKDLKVNIPDDVKPFKQEATTA